jgi:Fe-S cluster biosynthesis and repair protein YggX
MTRKVLCRKYGEELEGLDNAPFPGKAGEDIYQHVSKKAWQEWLAHQTMLINEKQLNVMDPQARDFLAEQRERFLNNESYEQAEGYVPPSS